MKPSASVSVLTPSIPGRERFLEECEASVRAQTIPVDHLIQFDSRGRGCARTVNELASRPLAPWLFILADDDLLLPRCLELLLEHADGTHVTYSPPLVWGEPAAGFSGEAPNIPCSALISTAAWREMGGYNERLLEREDNDLWNRMMRGGAIFRRYAEQPTWVYRFHGGNKSRRHRG